jgi:hypothetical protein
VKGRLNSLIGRVEGFTGKEGDHVRSHAEHLRELIRNIDWKLEIFTKVCPLDSGGYSKDAIEGASVPTQEITKENEGIAGGHAGG